MWFFSDFSSFLGSFKISFFSLHNPNNKWSVLASKAKGTGSHYNRCGSFYKWTNGADGVRQGLQSAKGSIRAKRGCGRGRDRGRNAKSRIKSSICRRHLIRFGCNSGRGVILLHSYPSVRTLPIYNDATYNTRLYCTVRLANLFDFYKRSIQSCYEKGCSLVFWAG